METVLIAGGTGLVGSFLTRLLVEEGYKVIILTRDPRKGQARHGVSYAAWDPARGTIDEKALLSAQHIINLAGAGVADQRWSAARKKEILDSRVNSGHTLCNAIVASGHRPLSFLQASAIGWYGPDPVIPNPHPFQEAAPADSHFLGATCLEWERSIQHLPKEIRNCTFRIGIVLSKNGGAASEFIKPLKFGVAAVLGSGKQVVSWIHIEDLCRMFLYALRGSSLHGVYNAVAPHPVNNRELTLALARARNGKAYLPMPVPSFVLKIMLGEMSIEVLKSATVSASRIVTAGFEFRYPNVEKAAMEVVS